MIDLPLKNTLYQVRGSEVMESGESGSISIANTIQRAAAIVDQRFKPILRSHPDLRRGPSTYTFNVKYYGGAPTDNDSVLQHALSDLENHSSYSIYFHYPFCKYACRFCHYPIKKQSESHGTVNSDLVDHLIRHFDLLLEKLPLLKSRTVSSIYLGGGTPSLLGGSDLLRFAEYVRSNIPTTDDVEWAIESTPDSLNGESIQHMIDAGFNRISTGIQILDDATLEKVGRGHTTAQSFKAIDLLSEHSEVAKNIDLMYGLPGISTEKFLSDVARIAQVRPQNITLYRLRLGRSDERPAALYSTHERDSHDYPDQIDTLTQITGARHILANAGYREGPLGWFHLPGYECQCYRDRWLKQTPMFGVGMGAYSYGSDWQSINTRNFGTWQREVGKRQLPLDRSILLSDTEKELRAAAFRLRYTGELSISGYATQGIIGKVASKLVIMGLAERGENTLRLNEAGKAFIDEIIDEYFQRDRSSLE